MSSREVDLLQGTLAYTGLEVLEPFIAWHVPYIEHEARVEISDKWRDPSQSLEGEIPLSFPSLDDFYERLYALKSAVWQTTE
ncbi:hypothetical protein VOM14_13335 [Paraburkholderia sp. MPAMCS5]|uniref:hypothetical protein n=1 Tax=Paraburkholderia sp. MPAMCS5 TaxID=3112563 RepID=UPI002E185929|nr:hypothetical protein [Paraburkholderia sp. MPAMCS5]